MCYLLLHGRTLPIRRSHITPAATPPLSGTPRFVPVRPAEAAGFLSCSMAKIPYIRWWIDDWIGGTSWMSRTERGAYHDLLMCQASNGPLTEGMIHRILGPDYNDVWPVIKDKFTEKNNVFFNKKMSEELLRVQEYSKSRASNRRKKRQLQKKHMKNTCISHEKHMGSGSGSGSNTSFYTSNIKDTSSSKNTSHENTLPLPTTANPRENTLPLPPIANPIVQQFDDARKMYPGTKRGLQVELQNLKKKHKDWKNIIPLLKPAIENQIKARKKASGFVPQWKHFGTWINQACWTEEPRYGDGQTSGSKEVTEFERANRANRQAFGAG